MNARANAIVIHACSLTCAHIIACKRMYMHALTHTKVIESVDGRGWMQLKALLCYTTGILAGELARYLVK